MQSQFLGRIYLWIHVAGMVMTGLMFVLVQVAGMSVLRGPVGMVSTLKGWGTLIGAVLFVVWVYQLHQDLQRLDADYPVSPGYALALLLIPVYNIWGIWAMWQAVSDSLPAPVWESRRLPRAGLLVNLLYGLVPLGLVLQWWLRSTLVTSQDIHAALSFVYMAGFAIDLTALLLCIVVMRGLEQKASAAAA